MRLLDRGDGLEKKISARLISQFFARLSPLLIPVIIRTSRFKMELVEEAMNHWRQQNGNRGDENHPAKQSIE